MEGPILQPMVAQVHAEFAARLNEALTDAGWVIGYGRRIRLAQLVGLSGESCRKWLNGESLPTMEHAIQVALHLGVYVEWLLTGRGPKRLPDPDTLKLVECAAEFLRGRPHRH